MDPERDTESTDLDWRAIAVGIAVTVLVVVVGDVLVSDDVWLVWVAVGAAIGGFVGVLLNGRRTRSSQDSSTP